MPDHEAAWAAIHALGFDPRTTAVVEATPDLPASGGRGQVSEIRSTPNRLSMQVTADGPALLAVSQVWYPGAGRSGSTGERRARRCGRTICSRACPFRAGTHQVELRFEPTLWGIGWVLAGAAALGLLAAALWLWTAKRR